VDLLGYRLWLESDVATLLDIHSNAVTHNRNVAVSKWPLCIVADLQRSKYKRSGMLAILRARKSSVWMPPAARWEVCRRPLAFARRREPGGALLPGSLVSMGEGGPIKGEGYARPQKK